jgi:hypothetical protein
MIQEETTMKRKLSILSGVLITILCSLTLGCPGPGPEPEPIHQLIEDFEGYPMDYVPPIAPWTHDCHTSYLGGDNFGIRVKFEFELHFLNLMYDIFDAPGNFGVGASGYAYAQIPFHAPRAGTVSFGYYHVGYNNFPANNDPSFRLDFWIQAPADIEKTIILFGPTWRSPPST